VVTYAYNPLQIEGNQYRAEKDGVIWRLVYDTPPNTATEEVVTSIQGILCKNGLPPFLSQIGYDKVKRQEKQMLNKATDRTAAVRDTSSRALESRVTDCSRSKMRPLT